MLYARKLEEGLSLMIVNKMHIIWYRALKDVVRWGLVAPNVCNRVSLPRHVHYKLKALTKEQAQHLFVTLHGHNMEALWVLALTNW
jgi:hypothetical protein